MQLLEHTHECEPKYDLWPYKRRNTGGSITKTYRCVALTMMHICTKFERNPSRNVACRAHTFPSKYDLWPYKRRNTWGQHHQNLQVCRFDYDAHLWKKLKKYIKKCGLQSAHKFRPKYDIWRYKRLNTGGSITKNKKCVDFTKIHLHTKFERNP